MRRFLVIFQRCVFLPLLAFTGAEERRSSARPLKDHRLEVELPAGALERDAFDHRLEVESPCRDSKGGGFSGSALGRRPQNRTKGADPGPALSNAKRVFCPGVLSSLCPGLPCRGFPGSGSLLLRSCPGGFLFVLCPASCFFPLAAGVTFQLPAGGTSGQVSSLRGRRVSVGTRFACCTS